MPLPKGYVLDTSQSAGGSGKLPQGYTMDSSSTSASPESSKYPWETAPSAPAQPGMLDPQGGKWNVGNFLRGAGQGISQFVQHPIDSLSQMPSLASTPPPVIYGAPKAQAAASKAYQSGVAEQGKGIREQAQFAKENPMYFAGEIAGPAALTHGISEVGGYAGDLTGRSLAKGLRSLTGTGEGATGKFVADIAEKNNTSIANAAEETKKAHTKVDEQNTKQAEQHKTDVSKYLKAQNKAETAKADLASEYKKGTAQQEKIEPTQKKLATSRNWLRAGIETAREKALAQGNANYSALNETLAPVQANPEMYTNAYLEASDALRGSKNPPGLLNAMGKKIEEGDPVTYADLQGDYSQLGKELSKGTLPGDIFHAYDQLHESIGNEMQRIADNNGMGQQLTDARNYWRRMKQTFGRPFPVGDTATKALSSAAPDLANADEQANRVRLLGSFDPGIPSMFNNVENIQKGLESLPGPTPARTRLRTLTEKQTGVQTPERPVQPTMIPHEAPVQPELMHVTPQSISQQKANAAFRATESIGGGRIPKSAIGMAHYLQRNAMGLLADTQWGREFVNSLTNLTQADIDQALRLPADQRSGFEAIVREAKKRGIPVGSGAVVGGVAGALRPAGQGNQQ